MGCLAYELAPGAGSRAAAMLSARGRARVRARERLRPSAQLTLGPRPDAEASRQPEPVTPADLHSAYQLPEEPPSGTPTQTIALVDAYNDFSAESDLRVFDHTFGLSECTSASGCFKQVNQHGESTSLPFPKNKAELQARESTCKTAIAKETLAQHHEREVACFEVAEATGWAVEIATDVEVAHSVCQTCQIRLVEASSAEYTALEAAERTAARAISEGGVGATEISNSWGGEEPTLESSAFERPGIVITASAGDDGYLNWTEAASAEAEGHSYYVGADYPASSPHVVAVGGTELTLTASGQRQSERVWNEDPNPEGGNSGGGGGGCSSVFTPQPWQSEVPDWSSVGCDNGPQPRRAVADIAADGDPYSGVLVYDSGESEESLLVIGGTSVASPIIAATFALAGGAGSVEYPARTLYEHRGSAALYDVTSGGNGRCDGIYTAGCSGSMSSLSPLAPLDCGQGTLICNAAVGYDGPTGLGTPNGIAAFQASEGERQSEGHEEPPKEEVGHEEAPGGGSEGKGAQGGGTGGGGGPSPTQPAQGVGAGGESLSGGSGGANGADLGAEGEEESGLQREGSGGGSRVRLSGLALTPSAVSAIAEERREIAEIALRFTLSAASRVRVRLARWLLVDGRGRWSPERGAFAIVASRGRGRVRLRGRASLPPGRYRVTLSPAHGAARSVTFVLG